MTTQTLDRRALRKAETRGALLGAARRLMAEGRTAVSIREITIDAGVGFGSFFNYFESKDELYEVAYRDSVAAHALVVNTLCRDIEDPAEAVSAALRLTGRLQRQMPEHFQVLLSRGTRVAVHERGLLPAFRRRLEAGNATGRLRSGDLDRTTLAVAGAVLGLVQLLELRPDLDAAREADDFTWRTLMTIGVAQAEAERLVHLDLPPVPGRG